MNILICSDGTDPADKPTKLGGLIAGPCKAATTLLGIAEKPEDEQPLRAALESEAELLRRAGITPEIVVRAGDPRLRESTMLPSSAHDARDVGDFIVIPNGLMKSSRQFRLLSSSPRASSSRSNASSFAPAAVITSKMLCN
jgi:HEAT repeat protein